MVECSDRSRGDVAAVAQHCHRLAQLEDFFEPMGYIDDRHPRLLQTADEGKQTIDLVAPQRTGRFVEHENLRLQSHGGSDLDELLLGNRQRREGPIDVDVESDLSQQRFGLAAEPAAVEKQSLPRQVVQTQVFGDRQVGTEHQLLVHDGDAGTCRVARRMKGRRVPADQNAPAVGAIHPRENLPQRALAGAVLSQQRVAFSRLHFETDVRQSRDAREHLGNVFEFNHGWNQDSAADGT